MSYCLNQHVSNHDSMIVKLATPGLLEISVFLNKAYDVIFPVHDVANKMLSRDSNYIVDVVM